MCGNGGSPRNCFSEKFRINYDSINWNKKMKIYSNELNNFAKKYNISLCELTFIVNKVVNYCKDENEFFEEIKKEIIRKYDRQMRKKIP